MAVSILGWVRNTTDEVDSCDPYLGDQTLLVRGVWANPDSPAAVPPGHRVTTPALHYTCRRFFVLITNLKPSVFYSARVTPVVITAPPGSVNNAAPGDASVS